MLTSTQRMQFDYWKGFAGFVAREGRIVRATAPPYPQNFLVVARLGKIGSCRFALEAAMHTRDGQIRAALELKGEERDTAYCFDRLRRDGDAIEDEVGGKLVWHEPVGRRRRSIQRLRTADVWSRAGRPEQYGWLLDSVEAMHRILAPRIEGLRTPL